MKIVIQSHCGRPLLGKCRAVGHASLEHHCLRYNLLAFARHSPLENIPRVPAAPEVCRVEKRPPRRQTDSKAARGLTGDRGLEAGTGLAYSHALFAEICSRLSSWVRFRGPWQELRDSHEELQLMAPRVKVHNQAQRNKASDQAPTHDLRRRDAHANRDFVKRRRMLPLSHHAGEGEATMICQCPTALNCQSKKSASPLERTGVFEKGL